MRAGPVGLIECFDTSYYILKDSYRHSKKFLKSQESFSIRDRWSEIAEHGIRGLPEVNVVNMLNELSVHAEEVDYSLYDVVICVNDIIPRTLRKRFRDTSFVCMPADGILPTRTFGYDAIITQYSSLRWERSRFLVDMPYTFAGPKTIEESLVILKRKSEQGSYTNKIYLEINSFSKRPVQLNEHKETKARLEEVGYRVCTHREYIIDNLTEISTSAFFVKVFGRPVRGNGVIESISAGCPVLARKDKLLDVLPLPEETYLSSVGDLTSILQRNDIDEFRARLLAEQRRAVDLYVKKAGMIQLQGLIEKKQEEADKSDIALLINKAKLVLRLCSLRLSLPLIEGTISWS